MGEGRVEVDAYPVLVRLRHRGNNTMRSQAHKRLYGECEASYGELPNKAFHGPIHPVRLRTAVEMRIHNKASSLNDSGNRYWKLIIVSHARLKAEP